MSNFPKLIATLLREGTGNFSVPETLTERDLERLIEKLKDKGFKRSINDVVMHTFPKSRENDEHDETFKFTTGSGGDTETVTAPNAETAFSEIAQQCGWYKSGEDFDEDDAE